MQALRLSRFEFPPIRGGIGAMVLQATEAAAAQGVDIVVVAADYPRKVDPSDEGALPFCVGRFRAAPRIFAKSAFAQRRLHLNTPLRYVAPMDVTHPAVHSRWVEPAGPAALAARLHFAGTRIVVSTGRITP